MKRIAKLLPDEYYLDKNFMPLAEKISKQIILSPYYQNIDNELLRDLVFDVLNAIKPKARQGADGHTVLY